MSNSPNIYEKKKTSLSLAGSGDPWSYLTRTRKNILRALHDRIPIDDVASIFGMSLDDLLEEIHPLIKSSLVRKKGDDFIPAFLIVNSDETKMVYEHSREMGELLANVIISKWAEIEDTFKKLSISENYSLIEQAFMLVGSRILDVGLLGELVKDGELLEVAPLRPSPTRPDAHYYFWMIEGDQKYLGAYGQEDIDLPWSDWHILNFGQSWMNNQRNEARDKTIKKYRELINSKQAENPAEFAKLLKIPFLNEKESEIWSKITKDISQLLMVKIKENEENLKLLFQNLESSKYTNNSYGEFICWYIHLVYPWAMDFLIEEKLIVIPSEHYSELVLYFKEPEGLLSGI